MIKGNVYIGQKRWPLSLSGTTFRTTKKTMRETLAPVAGLFDLAEPGEYYPDREKALWDFAAEFVSGFARFDIRERTDSATILDRIY